jgi:hypothetical protein
MNAFQQGNYALVAEILDRNSNVGLAVGNTKLWGEIGSAFIRGFAPYTEVASTGGASLQGAIARGWRAVAAKMAHLRGPDFQIFTASAGGGISKFAPVGEPLFDTIHGFNIGLDVGGNYSVGWMLQLTKPSRQEVMDFGKGIDYSVGVYFIGGFTLIANVGIPPTTGVAFGFGFGAGTSFGYSNTMSAYQEADRKWQRMMRFPWAR